MLFARLCKISRNSVLVVQCHWANFADNLARSACMPVSNIVIVYVALLQSCSTFQESLALRCCWLS